MSELGQKRRYGSRSIRSSPINGHSRGKSVFRKVPRPAFKPLWRQPMPDAFSGQLGYHAVDDRRQGETAADHRPVR
jgi:hypothetical protein